MRSNFVFSALITMFFVLIISGCSGSTDSVSNTKIDGVEWKLESLNGKPVTLKSGKYITLTLNRANGNLNGFGGCNLYYGRYFTEGKSMKLSEISATEMACDEISEESDYFNALGKIDGYNVSDGRLNLTSFGNAVAVFKK